MKIKNCTVLQSSEEEYDVSVCLISYNKSQYICQAIESILMQETECKYEIVIGDNASEDGTREILTEYWENHKDKFTILLNNVNKGITINQFTTMTQAKGKYIMMLNPDDYWISTNKMQQQYEFLEKHKEYVGVSSAVEVRMENQTYGDRVLPASYLVDRKISLGDYMNGADFAMNGLTYRGNILFDNIDHFKLMIKSSKAIDDASFCILLLMFGDVYNLSDITQVYRLNEISFTKNNSKYDLARKTIELYRNLDKYTGETIDFSTRYGMIMTVAVYNLLRQKLKLSELFDLLKIIPKKCRRTMWTSTIKGGCIYVGLYTHQKKKQYMK